MHQIVCRICAKDPKRHLSIDTFVTKVTHAKENCCQVSVFTLQNHVLVSSKRIILLPDRWFASFSDWFSATMSMVETLMTTEKIVAIAVIAGYLVYFAFLSPFLICHHYYLSLSDMSSLLPA